MSIDEPADELELSPTWAFRHAHLKLRDGLSLYEALDSDPWELELWNALDSDLWKIIFVCGSRGIGKSTNAAAFGVQQLVTRPGTVVLLFASDAEQASIVHGEAAGFIERDPVLSATLEVYKGRVVNPTNGSELKVMSSDAASSLGLGQRPTVFIADELTCWARMDLLTSILSALSKLPDNRLVVLSNAGYFNTEPYRLWNLCKDCTDGKYIALDSAARGWWGTWMGDREEILATQRALLPDIAFRRFWLNEWSSGSGEFLDLRSVMSCVDERLSAHTLTFDPTRRYYGGVDLGTKRDRSVFCIGHKEGETFVVDHLQTWHGSPDAPVSLEAVTAYIRDVASRIKRLHRLNVDPYQAVLMIERLKRAGVHGAEEFVFNVANVTLLSQQMWQAFRSKRIRIPNHEELVDELISARVVQKNYGWRIDHQANGHTDHIIAVALALLASGDKPGEIILDDPREDALIAAFRDRVSSPREFGFGRRYGLVFTPFPYAMATEETKRDLHAEWRLLQLMRRAGRLSEPEADMLEQRICSRVLDSRHPIESYEDGLEDELGDICDLRTVVLATALERKAQHGKTTSK